MKVGDLVRFATPGALQHAVDIRRFGIIVRFDEDDDPVIIWSTPSFNNRAEPNFRAHIIVLSKA
jgi:hypothetical protein